MACHWHDRCRIDHNLRDEEQVLRHSARATSRQCLGSRPQCVFAIGNGGDARDMVRVSGDRVCLVELMDPRLCLTSTAWLTSAAANCKAASLSLHWHGSSYSLLRPGVQKVESPRTSIGLRRFNAWRSIDAELETNLAGIDAELETPLATAAAAGGLATAAAKDAVRI
jgi:hypothetical protein